VKIRRVIDGKIYDTRTADEVATIASLDYGRNDCRYEKTALFLTKKGAWFIAGEGGPLTRWREKVADGWTSGCGLELVTPQEAQRLLEAVDGPVEDYFDVEEG
jgi:hypothetical protein